MLHLRIEMMRLISAGGSRKLFPESFGPFHAAGLFLYPLKTKSGGKMRPVHEREASLNEAVILNLLQYSRVFSTIWLIEENGKNNLKCWQQSGYSKKFTSDKSGQDIERVGRTIKWHRLFY